MDKKYFYNEKTHKLHIMGFCHHSKNLPYSTRFFDTYDEALAHDGRTVGLCKLCQNKENSKRKDS